MGRAAAASGQRDPFAIDEDAALAEPELVWADGGYHAFSADGGTLAGDAVTNAAALDDLRWHYGEAYLIEHFETAGRWVAQRRDSHGTMSAGSPDRLLGLIRADYAAHPVPRDPRPCRFLGPGRPPRPHP